MVDAPTIRAGATPSGSGRACVRGALCLWVLTVGSLVVQMVQSRGAGAGPTVLGWPVRGSRALEVPRRGDGFTCQV